MGAAIKAMISRIHDSDSIVSESPTHLDIVEHLGYQIYSRIFLFHLLLLQVSFKFSHQYDKGREYHDRQSSGQGVYPEITVDKYVSEENLHSKRKFRILHISKSSTTMKFRESKFSVSSTDWLTERGAPHNALNEVTESVTLSRSTSIKFTMSPVGYFFAAFGDNLRHCKQIVYSNPTSIK